MSGIMLPPGGGEKIPVLKATLKAAMGPTVSTSSFETVLGPNFDVGAHVHETGEELFFVLEGELDLLAFEPIDRSISDWHEWESDTGQRFFRGGPGAFMHVPKGVPHAFSNPTDKDVRLFFQSSVPGGHENYFYELAEIFRRGGELDQSEIQALRIRYDMIQLTDKHREPNS